MLYYWAGADRGMWRIADSSVNLFTPIRSIETENPYLLPPEHL